MARPPNSTHIPARRTVLSPITDRRKEAAEDAWNKMPAWFKKYGVLS